MTLNIALLDALSGLQANQRLLGVASQNVANVNTPGYTRKVGTQEALVLGGVGAGVDVSSISRSVNEYLLRDLRSQGAALGASQTLDEFYKNLQDLFGTPSSDSGIGAQVGALGNAFQALATSPDDASQQINVVTQARFAANQLNSLAGQVQDLRQHADSNIANAVDKINTQLDAIQALNLRISREMAAGQTTADLEDQRDQALGALSQMINITSFQRQTGETVVYAPGGQVLVDATAHHLSHSPTAQMSESLAWADGTVGPILLDGTDITGSLSSGTMGGLIQMRDTTLPNLAAQFDELATALADQINAAHNQGTSFPGAKSLTSERSFAATDLPGFTGTARFTVTDGTGAVVATTDVALTPATTIGGLLTAINTGLGMVVATQNASGQIVLQPPSGTDRIAVNEMNSQVTDGSATRGLSDFLGLNDFFATNKSYASYISAQQTSKTAAIGLAGTLTVSGAGFAPVALAYTAGDSLQSIATAINTDATLGPANVTASVVTDGSGYRLKLTDGDGDNLFLSDSGSLVATLDVKARAPAAAMNIAVRSDIVADPGSIAAATLSSAAGLAPGDVAVTPGDNTTAQAIANAFNQRISFAATGQLSAGSHTLADYGGAILSLNATQANNAANELDWRNGLYQTLSNKASAQSGVNLDEEMGNIILLQNAYAASARVINTTSQLFDILMNIRT
jgi:flagellar hook-associated protein 1